MYLFVHVEAGNTLGKPPPATTSHNSSAKRPLLPSARNQTNARISSPRTTSQKSKKVDTESVVEEENHYDLVAELIGDQIFNIDREEEKSSPLGNQKEELLEPDKSIKKRGRKRSIAPTLDSLINKVETNEDYLKAIHNNLNKLVEIEGKRLYLEKMELKLIYNSDTEIDIERAVTKLLKNEVSLRTKSPEIEGDFLTKEVPQTIPTRGITPTPAPRTRAEHPPHIIADVFISNYQEEIPALPQNMHRLYEDRILAQKLQDQEKDSMDTTTPPQARLEKRRREGQSTTEEIRERKRAKNPEGEFQIPRKTTRWSGVFKKRSELIPIKNRFKPLDHTTTAAKQDPATEKPLPTTSDDSSDEEGSIGSVPEQAAPQTRSTTKNSAKTPAKNSSPVKQQKPPPIVFDGVLTNRKLINEMIKEFTSKPFYFKFGRESTLLYMDNVDDFEMLKSKLEDDEVAFYTYTLKKDKSHAFVVRGLDFKPEPSEVKEDLEANYDIKIREVFALNTRFRPLYLILSLIGLTLMEYTARFFDKWIFETLLIGLGGYLLISIAMLFVIILDYLSPFTEVLFAAAGCIINMIGGIFTLIRYMQRYHFTNWFYIMYFSGDGGNTVELALGITSIILALVFSLDFFLNMREGLAISRGDSLDDIDLE
ncbi:unnamed protein product [Phaedon cochleariae]|uniref:Uncharacterized protein n=1 Tax=Phaedon cochleariae TaxID=80249 RepID=A0A9N9X5A1_PHACE|nr:unnamed protein product [Phaedon cochleariae]